MAKSTLSFGVATLRVRVESALTKWRSSGIGHLLDSTRCHQAREMLERTIVGSFGLVRKATGGKFAALEVVAQTLTTDSLSRAGVIATVAVFQVPGQVAFHLPTPMSVLTVRQLRFWRRWWTLLLGEMTPLGLPGDECSHPRDILPNVNVWP